MFTGLKRLPLARCTTGPLAEMSDNHTSSTGDSNTDPKKDSDQASADFLACSKRLERSLSRCQKVVFMRERLEKLGCHLPRESFVCQPCQGLNISGGWCPSEVDEDGNSAPKIVMCQDKKVNQTIMNHTIAHELIHAFDQCRMKLDWNNCLHHACSEVRASNTSGECNLTQEWRRGHLKWSGQQKECVKRRAELSVRANPNCADRAREFVETAFASCYYDTEPYDKNPWY